MGLDWTRPFCWEKYIFMWLYIICNAWSFGIMMGREFLDLIMERLAVVCGVS